MRRTRRLTPLAILVVSAALLAACGGSSGGTAKGAASTTTAPASSSVALVPAAEVLTAVAGSVDRKDPPPDLQPRLQDANGDSGFTQLQSRGCSPGFGDTRINTDRCVFGDPKGAKTMVVLGDSHAQMWTPAFDLVGKAAHWRVLVLGKVNCGAAELPDYYLHQEKRPYTECPQFHAWAVDLINSTHPDLVVLASRVPGSSPPGKTRSPQEWSAGMKTMLAALTGAPRKVILGDIPAYPQVPGPVGCLGRGSVDACSQPVSAVVNSALVASEADAAAAAGAKYVNTTPWFCTTNTCVPVVDKYLVYKDYQHVTGAYARYLAGALREALEV